MEDDFVIQVRKPKKPKKKKLKKIIKEKEKKEEKKKEDKKESKEEIMKRVKQSDFEIACDLFDIGNVAELNTISLEDNDFM